MAVTDIHERKFSDVYGKLLINSYRLPNSNFDRNFILREVCNWVYVTLKSFNGENFGLLKLNLIEAAILLNTTVREVIRLIEFGALKTISRLKPTENISPYSPILRLQDVFEHWICSFQTEHSHLNHFLSKW